MVHGINTQDSRPLPLLLPSSEAGASALVSELPQSRPKEAVEPAAPVAKPAGRRHETVGATPGFLAEAAAAQAGAEPVAPVAKPAGRRHGTVGVTPGSFAQAVAGAGAGAVGNAPPFGFFAALVVVPALRLGLAESPVPEGM